jgi:hypothetical protein
MPGPKVGIRFEGEDYVSPKVKSIKTGIAGLATEAKKSILTGVGLGAGVTAFNLLGNAARSAIGFLKDSIGAASMLAESQGKVNVVFGESSKEISDWARTASSAFGQSTQQALEAAGTYGNLFRAFGFTTEAATGMSKTMVELAADLASFNNTSIDDALLALRSGLSGETEPLKRYGIAISDARMRTELAAQGFKNLGATLTPLQKTTAAYALIMKDSALAQGDFGRTADGLANVGRTLEAQMADLSAEIGQQLLPILRDLAIFARDVGIPAIRGLADAFGELGDALVDERSEAALDRLFARFSGRPIANWAEENFGGVRQAIEAEAPAIAFAAGTAWSPIHEKLVEASNKAIAEAKALPGDIAKALKQGMDDVESGMTELTDLMKNSLSDAAKIARLKGILASKELAAGLRDERADVRAAAMQIRDDALEQLQLLESGAADAAVDTGTTFAEQLRLQRVAAAEAAADIKRGVQGNMEFADEAGGWGSALVKAWADGVASQWNYAHAKAIYLGTSLSGPLKGYSPPKEGPLKEIDVWGENIGKAWAGGLDKGIGTAKLGSMVPGAAAGGSFGLATAGAAVGGGGLTVNFNSMWPPTETQAREVADIVSRRLYYSASGSSRFPRG